MKIVTILGARPQFIKAAAVSQALSRLDNIQEVLLHTGQHFDNEMSNVFFDELAIPEPKYNLGIGGGLHGAMTGAQLAAVEETLLLEKPDWVLVYGDTNSTLAGALAAAKLNIPIAHVEAGLRSFNRKMPEEINRVVTDHVSTTLFAPTAIAMQNLANEGIPSGQCFEVGDVMYDAALLCRERAKQSSDILRKLGLSASKYFLVTIHRAENTDDSFRLKNIIDALRQVSSVLPVIWPVHPRTRKRLEQEKLLQNLGDGIQLISPLGYLDMVMLEQDAAVIATDSGGVQKEAFFYEVPCVTLRDETEWKELVESGWNHLAPPANKDNIVETIMKVLNTHGKKINPYGDGTASKKIANILYGTTP